MNVPYPEYLERIINKALEDSYGDFKEKIKFEFEFSKEKNPQYSMVVKISIPDFEEKMKVA